MNEKIPNLQLRMLADARETTLFELAAGRLIVAGNACKIFFILKITFYKKFRFLDNPL